MRYNYVSLSRWGAVLRSRQPLSSTVEATTRRQNGPGEGTIRSSIRAAACLASRLSYSIRSIVSTSSC